MGSMDLRDHRNIDAFMDWFLAQTRKIFVAQGGYHPCAHIASMRDPQGKPTDGMCLTFVHCNGPDVVFDTSVLKEAIVRYEAFAIVLASEAWVTTVPADDAGNAVRTGMAAAAGATRSEALIVSLEHVALTGSRVWRASITRDAAGKPTLGPFGTDHVDAVGGRFTNLLRSVKGGVN